MADYEAIRAHDTRFIVLPRHVTPEIEEVVRRRNGHLAVEKVGAGAEAAQREQPAD